MLMHGAGVELDAPRIRKAVQLVQAPRVEEAQAAFKQVFRHAMRDFHAAGGARIARSMVNAPDAQTVAKAPGQRRYEGRALVRVSAWAAAPWWTTTSRTGRASPSSKS